jgi:multidrug efflux pump subunit AcrB
MADNRTKRYFGLTGWAYRNKNTVYILIVALVIFGLWAYRSMPKELFPEMNYPTIFVQTVYPGNSAADIENLVTKPLEKELKGVSGIKHLKSISAQDYSMIFVEFPANADIDAALQDVKDAVERAKPNLPDDLPHDPQVIKFNFAQFPIVFVNLSGNYTHEELKRFAEYLKDEFETIPEVSKVEIKGLPKKEVQVNVDLNKMEQMGLSFNEIINAIKMENVTVSAGQFKTHGALRQIRIVGEFKNVDQIKNIVVRSIGGKPIYLGDVADVKFTYADPDSYARLDGKPVVSLEVIKKDKANQLNAMEHIYEKLAQAKATGHIPDGLKVTLTNDMSKVIRRQLHSLGNNMIEGIIFVVLVLFMFLGLRNSLIVGFSIPMSLLISFILLELMGYTLNNIVLFSLILALGMLVDNAIVVTENIYRFVDNGVPLKRAVVDATSEIAIPIIASTLTTLAAFFPLIFWNTLIGEFMKLLPITLIIVLSASLFTALVINPVISYLLIKPVSQQHAPKKKLNLEVAGGLFALAVPFYATKVYLVANILTIVAGLILLYVFALYPLSKWFQNRFLPWLERVYDDFIKFSLRGKNALWITILTFALMIFTFWFYFAVTKPKVIMFPDTDPRFINVFVYMPAGTDLDKTDSVTRVVEKDINRLLKPYKKIVSSVMTTVGTGVARDKEVAVGKTLNRARITINFVDYDKRGGISTAKILKMLSDSLINRYPGVDIFLERDKHGPSSGRPIDIEISGDDLNVLFQYGDSVLNRIEHAGIRGYEKLEFDMKNDVKELKITIDRKKAGQLGLSTGMIAQTIRTALFGTEASKYKTSTDEYPINVRLAKKYRENLDDLLNLKIPIKSFNGKLATVPISSVVKIELTTTVDAIRHKDTEPTLTISSNVIEGYNANQINQQIKAAIASLKLPDGYSITFGGEQEDMKESMQFMILAMAIALALILTIMVTQFNSLVKPLIILLSVLFSTIGVFIGYSILGLNLSILMSGIGIIALAGVVVNNGIVLIDYIELLKRRKREELGLEADAPLPKDEIRKAIIKAGHTRLRPVLLTAITTVLGIFPMAIGMNIDFKGFLLHLKPDIYFGGESMQYWKHLSWAIIWGLSFATFLTLIVEPSMYWLANRVKLKALGHDK